MKRGLVKDKTGQFYLIAAIIISVITIGLITLSNYSREEESMNIQYIGDELKIESEKVLDYGAYNGYSESQIQDLMETFSTNYMTYVEESKDSYFLFGNSDSITVTGYSHSDKTISVNTGSGKTSMSISKEQVASQEFNPQSNNVTLTIDGTDYEFELKGGQNFYFVVSQEIGGAKHVARN